ncbi:MAG: PA0069 family radical SAM protein [Alphaproteobacteria bacterium]|nr:PA0069 family radical SAM protein [Alphaproteobacteria bacterium]
MVDELPSAARKGRGAVSNPDGRFEASRRVVVDDGWARAPAPGDADDEPPPLATTLTVDASRTIIARNDSPDIPFSQSINPYRGCEHGCVYCYARPSHGYLGLSAGLDFETKLFFKPEGAKLLRAELARPGYKPSAIAFGSNTDPYQPVERRLGLTRQLLEVLVEHEHPFTIVTKSANVVRDIDLIAAMSAKRLAKVFVSVTTLDRELARKLEPRASTPARRLEAIRALAGAGVHVGVMTAPIIPALTDHEVEALLQAAHEAGAVSAGYTVLRLPFEIKDLFKEWLAAHAPLRAEHVLSRVMQLRGGRLNDPEFGSRMRGTGLDAELIARRFRLACQRLGLNKNDWSLDLSRFRVPAKPSAQMSLF